MTQLVLVEGLPGSGKTTTARLVEEWFRARTPLVQYFGEGRTDHPVDFEQASVLTPADLSDLCRAFPAESESLVAAAVSRDGVWIVPERERPSWSDGLRSRLRARDVYDGDVGPTLHRRVLLDSWRRFAVDAMHGPAVHVFECVAIQNPVCALLARFDLPSAEVGSHIHEALSAVAGLDPLLLYLDAGDPEPVLTAAAAGRPAAWLDFVVRYHTEQGYGRARGLDGFAGLVAFMRARRELELALVDELPLRTHVIDVADRDRSRHRDEVMAALHEASASGAVTDGTVPVGGPVSAGRRTGPRRPR